MGLGKHPDVRKNMVLRKAH